MIPTLHYNVYAGLSLYLGGNDHKSVKLPDEHTQLEKSLKRPKAGNITTLDAHAQNRFTGSSYFLYTLLCLRIRGRCLRVTWEYRQSQPFKFVLESPALTWPTFPFVNSH